MRLRPYISRYDFEYVSKWINSERVHALWCANTIPFPLDQSSFDRALEKNTEEWKDSAYVATDDQGVPVGFFSYVVDVADNTGFLKYIVLDSRLRGKGYGRQMISLALKYAFEITGAAAVRLNVFDVNENAKKCYASVGFKENTYTENALSFQNETWGRYQMLIRKE